MESDMDWTIDIDRDRTRNGPDMRASHAGRPFGLQEILQPIVPSSSRLAQKKIHVLIPERRYGFQEILQPIVACSRLAQEKFQFPTPKKINDYVYEVCKPPGRPSVEIVFFHGVPLEDPSSKDIHITTWVSRNGLELWLNWLLGGEYLSDARIVTISYDASPWMTADEGILDMHCTRENLIPTLTGAEVGQDGCPVVLVGHCLGGLVMKEVCVQAHLLTSLIGPGKPNQPVQNLLHHIKGLFTYASPHHGSRLADSKTRSQKGVLFEGLTTLNTDAARRNEDFRKLRDLYQWRTCGVGESLPVFLKSLNFIGKVVEEASARRDVDDFYTVAADHFTVSRPFDRKCSSFQLLSSFVSMVVKEDKGKLSSNIRLLTEPKIVGLQAKVKNVEEKLQEKQRLGIVGIGGIGKTTLAKALFDEISWKFEFVCFLEEVKSKMGKEVTSNHLRAKIIEGLKWKGHDVAKNFEWTALQAKTVLVILDDVKCESQVMVMLESDNFSKDSRLVVTSRQGNFLRGQGFEIYDAIALDSIDSKRLFCFHVFGQPEMPVDKEDMSSFATSFVEKCGGLPLALKVSGRYLSQHTENNILWNEALEKLHKAEPMNGDRDDGLWSILMVIYKDLPTSEQEMFLDAATCFYMTSLEKVQEAWAACTWASPVLGWENLLDRYLVTKDDYGRISMHEILRCMGRSIAHHSRVYTTSEANQLSEEEKATVKVLKIHRFDDENYDDVDIFFRWSGESSDESDDDQESSDESDDDQESSDESDDDQDKNGHDHLDNVILYGWKKLQILWLDTIVPRLERIEELQELRQLKLESKQPEIVRGRHPLESIGKLRKLRYLEISKCYAIKTIPSTIRNLRTLEHLRIQDCESLTKLPERIGELAALKHLEIRKCRSLEGLPKGIGKLPALEHLEICKCRSLKGIPEFEGIGRLGPALTYLEIRKCRSLEGLPYNIGNLRALKHLKIRYCENLRELPEFIDQLSELRHLEITDCENLLVIPASIGKLSQLRHLVISNCCTFILSWGAKRELGLKGLACPQHERPLPHTLGKLDKLETLVIGWNFDLTEFPEFIGQLTALRHLAFRNCGSLENIPEFIGQLKELRLLEFVDCLSLESPTSRLLEQLHALDELVIDGCIKITQPPRWARQCDVRVRFNEGVW